MKVYYYDVLYVWDGEERFFDIPPFKHFWVLIKKEGSSKMVEFRNLKKS